jgi:dTDP-4-amino-4,6-dideoxygalactose transaminase
VRSLGGWTMPFADTIDNSSGHLMVIVAPDPDVRERAVHALREAGIQSSMHYPCVADFTGFPSGSDANLELTRQFTRRATTLPLYPTLYPDRINDIVEILRAINS